MPTAKQLPAKISGDHPLRVTLEVAENPGVVPFPQTGCELRLGFRGLSAEAKPVVSLNGQPLPPGRRFTTSQFVKSVPKQPDLAQDYYHVALSNPSALARGANAFEVSVSGETKSVELTDLEVRFDYQNDYVKLWEREPVRLNGAVTGRPEP